MQKWLKWKRWLLCSTLLLFAYGGTVLAATSDNIDLHVSIAGTKAILVEGTTYYDFGALDVSTAAVSASSFTIKNNSPVFVETFTVTGANALSTTGGTDWTLSSSTGTNQYALAAQFSDTQPSNINSAWSSDDLTTSASTCSQTVHGNGTEAESGANVPVNNDRYLWFRIKTPSSVTDSSQHTINVTVSVL